MHMTSLPFFKSFSTLSLWDYFWIFQSRVELQTTKIKAPFASFSKENSHCLELEGELSTKCMNNSLTVIKPLRNYQNCCYTDENPTKKYIYKCIWARHWHSLWLVSLKFQNITSTFLLPIGKYCWKYRFTCSLESERKGEDIKIIASGSHFSLGYMSSVCR